MAGQDGLPPEVYDFDLKILLNERYTQGMLFFIVLFPAIVEAYSSHFCYADGI